MLTKRSPRQHAAFPGITACSGGLRRQYSAERVTGGETSRPGDDRLPKRTTAFVTLPIVALAAASLAVVLASLAIGAREVDSIALARQRETIEHALDQHGLFAGARAARADGVERVLREDARARYRLDAFVLRHLSQPAVRLRPHLRARRRRHAGVRLRAEATPATRFRRASAAVCTDLLVAVRNPAAMLPAYNVVTTDVPLAMGKIAHHRAVADVRAIDGRPATVVVSTIMPDRGPARTGHAASRCCWSPSRTSTRRSPSGSAITSASATCSGSAHGAARRASSEPSSRSTAPPSARSPGASDRPGWSSSAAWRAGLGIVAPAARPLTYLLIRWGSRQAKQHPRTAKSTRRLQRAPTR